MEREEISGNLPQPENILGEGDASLENLPDDEDEDETPKNETKAEDREDAEPSMQVLIGETKDDNDDEPSAKRPRTEEPDSSSSVSDAEIDKMLEEGVQVPPSNTTIFPDKRTKVVLKVLGRDHFDILPEGWVEVPHNSGMPVYLHKDSRVCTITKPYFLGPASTRKHDIPVSAIPCLNYRRELDRQQAAKEEDPPRSFDSVLPQAKIESAQESQKENCLDYLAVRKYCEKLFRFETITVCRYKSWASKRKHDKVMKKVQLPMLPESTKLITVPVISGQDRATGSAGLTKKEFVLNPSGKSYICILHEYIQHALKTQPKFIFKEREESSTPYQASVMIGSIEYGTGCGSSKKQAKSEAARAAVEALIPEMKNIKLDSKATSPSRNCEDTDFFDDIQIEDVRVTELCTRAGQPTPYQVLLECLKRNFGMGNTDITCEMTNLNFQRNKFVMNVGENSATVICKNKRDGKQRASQAILKIIHPFLSSWGSLLGLYGKGSYKTMREKKEEELEITVLQSQAQHNQPNYAILAKLKEEMLKLRAPRNKEAATRYLPSTSSIKTAAL